MVTRMFKTEALLLVVPTTEYQKRVPVTIGTSLTDMAVDSLGTLDSSNLTTPWKQFVVPLSPEEKCRHTTFRNTWSK